MATFGTVYSYPNNPRVAKIQAVANLNGLEIEVPEFKMGETNRTPDFLAKFPLGKVPAFSGADGTNLFDSSVIAQYVAESGPAATQLVGSTPAERATIQQWISVGDSEIGTNVVTCFLPRVGLAKYNEAADNAALAGLEGAVAALETHLSGRTWVATKEKFSLADISLAAALNWGFASVIDQEMRAKYPGVVAWYQRTVESEGVKTAFGETHFVEKRVVPQ